MSGRAPIVTARFQRARRRVKDRADDAPPGRGDDGLFSPSEFSPSEGAHHNAGGFASTWPEWAFGIARDSLLYGKKVWVLANGDPFGSNLVNVLLYAP
jgi:hypothetical protein